MKRNRKVDPSASSIEAFYREYGGRPLYGENVNLSKRVRGEEAVRINYSNTIKKRFADTLNEQNA